MHALAQPVLSEYLLAAVLDKRVGKLLRKLLLFFLHLLDIVRVIIVDDLVGEVHESLAHLLDNLLALIIEFDPVEV